MVPMTSGGAAGRISGGETFVLFQYPGLAGALPGVVVNLLQDGLPAVFGLPGDEHPALPGDGGIHGPGYSVEILSVKGNQAPAWHVEDDTPLSHLGRNIPRIIRSLAAARGDGRHERYRQEEAPYL